VARSAYSSSPKFIAAVHPKYAIISVGRHNMSGIPRLQRFSASNVSGPAFIVQTAMEQFVLRHMGRATCGRTMISSML